MKIEAYKPKVTPLPYDNYKKLKPAFYVLHDKTGGWNPETGVIAQFKADYEEYSVEDFLANITAAVEAGAVDSDTFLLDFFGTDERVFNFADKLDEYSEEAYFWVNDRYFKGILEALDGHEGDFVTFEAMAQCFRERAKDMDKKPKPAAKAKAKAKSTERISGYQPILKRIA